MTNQSELKKKKRMKKDIKMKKKNNQQRKKIYDTHQKDKHHTTIKN